VLNELAGPSHGWQDSAEDALAADLNAEVSPNALADLDVIEQFDGRLEDRPVSGDERRCGQSRGPELLNDLSGRIEREFVCHAGGVGSLARPGLRIGRGEANEVNIVANQTMRSFKYGHFDDTWRACRRPEVQDDRPAPVHGKIAAAAVEADVLSLRDGLARDIVRDKPVALYIKAVRFDCRRRTVRRVADRNNHPANDQNRNRCQ